VDRRVGCRRVGVSCNVFLSKTRNSKEDRSMGCVRFKNKARLSLPDG
jgi:hypothetical protein